MKIYLYPNLDKTHCFEYTTATYERLRKNGAKLFMDRCYNHDFGKLDITFCSEDECVKYLKTSIISEMKELYRK